MKLGSNDIGSVYIGSTAVNKIYIGSTEVWTSFTGLLDTYPNAAAAYSLRQLKSGVTNAIRVRRASDNAESDIGFVSGELDTTTLETFCSGTNGFVTTWYDQSGNGYDATQSTSANQPQIVSSGSVILENSKPCMQFDGSNDYLTSNMSFTQPFFVSLVVKNIKDESTYPYYLDSNSSGRFLLYVEYRNGITASAAYISGFILNSSIIKTTQSLISALYNSSSSFISIDSTIAVSGTINSNSINSPIYIGSRNTTAQNMQGTYQELLFWDSNQSSNRTGIETNINNFYNIY